MADKIFISYSRRDEEHIETLCRELSAAGFEPWIDKNSIRPGRKWSPEIAEAIEEANFFLSCLSKNSVGKEGEFYIELRHALAVQKRKREDQIYLIPVMLEDCEVPRMLAGIQRLDLYRKDGLRKLIETLRGAPGGQRKSADDFLADYTRARAEHYRTSGLLDHYVELNCRIKGAGSKFLTSYVLDEWLPDRSKALLAVLGEFGSGKTLFCHRLADELFTHYEPGKRIPLVIRLRDMRADDVGTFSEHISAFRRLLVMQFQSKLGDAALTWEALERMLRSGKILLVFDGFEEMTIEAGRFRLSRNFRVIRSTIAPGTKAIITCRTHYFSREREERILLMSPKADEVESLIMGESAPESVSIVYLQPFDDRSIRFYLKSRSKTWRQIYTRIKAPEFYDLQDLAKRPIFLDVIVETLPGLTPSQRKVSKTDLYQEYAELCFTREAERIRLNEEAQSRIIEDLAFAVYRKRLSDFGEDLVKTTIPLVVDRQDYDAGRFIRMCPFFTRVEGRERRLDFIHQSFFEFFVAKRIARAIRRSESHVYAQEYLISPIDGYLIELLDAIGGIGIVVDWLEKDGDVNVRMNCAVTLGRTGRQEYVPVLRERLEHERDIGVAGRIADALESLGDEEALVSFLRSLGEKYDYPQREPVKTEKHRLLYDIVGPYKAIDPAVIDSLVGNLEHPNSRIRKFTAFVLGRTGAAECVPGLIKLLGNRRETIRARRYAAAALGLIGRSLIGSSEREADREEIRDLRRAATPVLSEVSLKGEHEFLRRECSKALEEINPGREGSPMVPA